MSTIKTAKRYAHSLLAVANEQKLTNKVLADCQLISNTISGSRELKVFLKSPIVKQEKKLAVLKELFFDSITSLTITFIDIVTKKDRLTVLNDIALQYEELYNQQEGILRIKVKTAKELSSKEQKSLEKSLSKRTGKTIQMLLEVDPELLGGLTVQIQDTIVDGSVKNKLDSLQSIFHTSVTQ